MGGGGSSVDIDHRHAGRIPLQAGTVSTDSNWEHGAPCQGPAAKVKVKGSHPGTYKFTKSSPTERSHKVNCVRP